MKTFITVSIESVKKAALTKQSNENIHNTVDAALILMESGQLVQLKVTNLPMREDT